MNSLWAFQISLSSLHPSTPFLPKHPFSVCPQGCLPSCSQSSGLSRYWSQRGPLSREDGGGKMLFPGHQTCLTLGPDQLPLANLSDWNNTIYLTKAPPHSFLVKTKIVLKTKYNISGLKILHSWVPASILTKSSLTSHTLETEWFPISEKYCVFCHLCAFSSAILPFWECFSSVRIV